MNWKIIFKSLKNRDMQKRLAVIIGLVIVFRMLTFIPIPLADPTQLKDVINTLLSTTDLGGFINLLSGGAMAQFSVVMVGLSPYITASIISQLLTKAIPKMEELQRDGESGRRKINQWTRMLTVPLAIVQSIAMIYLLQQYLVSTAVGDVSMSLTDWSMAVIAMTAGAVMIMWLGELITEQGIGNGISLLIFAGIIAGLPDILGTLWFSLTDTSAGALSVFGWFELPISAFAFWVTLALGLTTLAIIYILVKINEAQRIVTINYAKRVQGNSTYGGIKSVLPIKMIAAGVIPVIFAVAFLSLPAFVGQVLLATKNEAYTSVANNLVTWFQAPNPGEFTGTTSEAFIYPVVYFILVIAFTYFYTGVVFNSNEIAENLQKQGGFIEGRRPGIETEKYLTRTVNRLILFGSLVLGLVAVVPFIAEYLLFNVGGISAGARLSIGGTGILIVVQVALEALRQLNSRALMVTYDDYK